MFEPDTKVDTLTQAVKLHLSSDDYKGELLVVEKADQKEGGKKKDGEAERQVFKTTRMLPPGEVYYYFSIDGKAQQPKPVEGERQAQDPETQLMRVEVPKMNMIENIVQSKAVVSNTYIQEELNCIPRP